MLSRVDTLYAWVLNELNRLTGSGDSDQFEEDLPDDRKGKFGDLVDDLVTFKDAIESSHNTLSRYPDWLELGEKLIEWEMDYPDFPAHCFRKLRLFCLLAKNLEDLDLELEGADVDETLFRVGQLQDEIDVNWFQFENTQRFPHSAAFISGQVLKTSKSSYKAFWENTIEKENFSREFLYHILASLSHRNGEISHQYFLIKRQGNITDIKAEAFVKLLMVSKGMQLHKTTKYAQEPSLANENLFKPSLNYHQFGETYFVLSEYNSRKDLLSKYLSLYHVFENLMYRRQIADLNRKVGRQFSIRDFKSLYRRVDQTERSVLKALFKTVFDKKVSGQTPVQYFKDRIENSWNAACVDHIAAIESLMENIGLPKVKHNNFTGKNRPIYFADIVYDFRCVIVHNNETEWHLSQSNLDAASERLLRTFLIPSLEEICFELLGQNVPEIWYTHKNLQLY